MAVTETEVRDLLDSPAATSVPSATITSNITRAAYIVDQNADDTATTTQKDHASRAIAVWLTYISYMEGITQQLGAISIADQVKLDALRQVAELLLNLISSTHIDLDVDTASKKKHGIHPTTFGMTTSEAYRQDV